MMKDVVYIDRPQPISAPDPLTDMEVLMNDYPLSMVIFGGPFDLDIRQTFRWNGMSIPRIVWITTGTPFSQKHRLPGMVHDRLYEIKIMSRKMSDMVMLQLLLENGETRYNAHKMYYAVRTFGGGAWKKANDSMILTRGVL